MATETPLQRLSSHLLGEPVARWIWARRWRPGGASWRKIADELKEATDGQIKVPAQTIYNWASAADPELQAGPTEQAS